MAMMKGCTECGKDFAAGYCPHQTVPVFGTQFGTQFAGETFIDTRTDAEVRAAVDKAAGDHYEVGSLHTKEYKQWLDKTMPPGTIAPILKSEPLDIPQQCNASHWALRVQTKDYSSNFYGPSPCDGCGDYDVIRSETGKGFPVTSWNERKCKGGVEYTPHHCTHLLLFKKLAGKVLTVIDAALTTNPKQHKAVCDLLRKAFAETISRARELEGDNCNETVNREELA